jgi:hypothetical protein
LSRAHKTPVVDGVGDERAFYAATNGLVESRRRGSSPERHPMAQDGLRARRAPGPVAIFWPTGMSGFFAGPGKHVIDHYALTDPLLARLPAARLGRWRIGHFARTIPDGYLESLSTSENRLVDPGLARLWDELRLVTRGPLLSRARLAAVWRLNSGQLGALVHRRAYREPGWKLVRGLRIVDDAKPPPVEHAGPTPRALLVRLEPASHASRLVLRVEAGRALRVGFQANVAAAALEHGALRIAPAPGTGLVDVVLDVPPRAAALGFDTLRIITLDGRGPARIGGWKDAPP